MVLYYRHSLHHIIHFKRLQHLSLVGMIFIFNLLIIFTRFPHLPRISGPRGSDLVGFIYRCVRGDQNALSYKVVNKRLLNCLFKSCPGTRSTDLGVGVEKMPEKESQEGLGLDFDWSQKWSALCVPEQAVSSACRFVCFRWGSDSIQPGFCFHLLPLGGSSEAIQEKGSKCSMQDQSMAASSSSEAPQSGFLKSHFLPQVVA